MADSHRACPHIVIVGAGFAGLNAARRLRKADADITIVDRTNHHLFQPLLYQVATATLAPSDITVPIRWVVRRHARTRVVLGTVTSIDAAQRVVHVDTLEQPVAYDFLILAAGTRHSYFGRDEWEEHAPGLKSLEDALMIRRRFLLSFERAELEDDPAVRAALQTFVIVGGGPTGVELAGMLPGIAREAFRRDFRRIDTRDTRVVLVEGGPGVLAHFPDSLSAQALRDLEHLGVEVLLNSIVTGVDARGVSIGARRIISENVFWAAGNNASPLGRTLGVPLDRAGRVLVEPDLSVPGHPEIFVAGDLAAIAKPGGGWVPGVAPAATQSGHAAAENLMRTLRGEPGKPFRYFNKGDLATIGRHRAVAAFGKVRIHGTPAWVLWLFVHIMYLVGFRNRVSVLLQWTYAYFTFQRGVRLITEAESGREAPMDGPSLRARPDDGVRAHRSAEGIAAKRPGSPK